MDDNELDEVVNEFIVESHENLDDLDRALVLLEHDNDPNVVARIFRTIHTIKGTSGFLGFSTLESVSHVGENLLSKLRDRELMISTEITSGLLAMVDAIREILQTVSTSGDEAGLAYPALVERLTELAVAPTAGVEPEAAPAPATFTPLTEIAETTPDVGEVPKPQGEDRPPASETLRVDVSLLDDLMNLVGELVLARNQILQFVQPQGDPAFNATSQRLNLITTELQAGVMKTRMQPIENVWNKFPRVVRDLTINCGKQARLEMEGKHTELDKTLLEAIKDPLTHLVRNAVDHGLESPANRLASGKSTEGLVRLSAYHEGGQVIVEISDDGAGIDADKLRRKAIQKGLLTSEEAHSRSDREMLNVIFLPGFSTAEAVSNISGRGVGMDVVRTNIEGIGGSVEVQTVLGAGTTFRVKIPLTLAIVPALVVSVGQDRYAIPQVSLIELVRLDAHQSPEGATVIGGIEWVQGLPVHRLRGQLLPLVFLRDVFENDLYDGVIDSEPRESFNIVVVQADDHQFGLVVDDISDTAEIVVKPLGRLLKSADTFAGATIMGDGRVALILDVMGIANRIGITTSERRGSRAATGVDVTDVSGTWRRLLLFSLGDRHLGLPLEAVARLEEFSPADIEMSGHRAVVQYRGEIMHLIDLGDELGMPSSRVEGQPMQVVVYTDANSSVGLVVDQIFDIVEEHLDVTETADSHGIAGTAVIHGQVTDVIAVKQILRSAVPAIFATASEVAA
ncbi:MAG: histidine kinase [Acidimicrobiales bacterium]|nr:histidine kinase [Acidimicrobiales bacterium]